MEILLKSIFNIFLIASLLSYCYWTNMKFNTNSNETIMIFSNVTTNNIQKQFFNFNLSQIITTKKTHRLN